MQIFYLFYIYLYFACCGIEYMYIGICSYNIALICTCCLKCSFSLVCRNKTHTGIVPCRTIFEKIRNFYVHVYVYNPLKDRIVKKGNSMLVFLQWNLQNDIHETKTSVYFTLVSRTWSITQMYGALFPPRQ